ncbi:MAG: universal stress protein [Nitrososphaerota archaeon]|nr:universal stress protein [Nitrososphaerota archaeon]
MIRKVLVAVDGSENSERALDFAVDFVERYCAELTVLNVSESVVAAYLGDDMIVVARDLHRLHEAILDKAVAYVGARNSDLRVWPVLREGDPAIEIVAVAKEGAFDVVVLGHQGVGKVKGIFLGSISAKVARLLSCTVVIVK